MEAAVMKWTMALMGAAAMLAVGAPAAAELPMPPMAAAPQQATAYLFYGGAGDVYEVTSSIMAVQHAMSPDVRAFATMMIADHAQTTNATLAAAKAAGVPAPPPVLSPAQMGMITQLGSAGANFDRVWLQQQMMAHQQALALQRGYAANGDTPALRQAAAAAVPVIEGHLARVKQLMASVG
jgi:putative membrane protein